MSMKKLLLLILCFALSLTIVSCADNYKSSNNNLNNESVLLNTTSNTSDNESLNNNNSSIQSNSTTSDEILDFPLSDSNLESTSDEVVEIATSDTSLESTSDEVVEIAPSDSNQQLPNIEYPKDECKLSSSLIISLENIKNDDLFYVNVVFKKNNEQNELLNELLEFKQTTNSLTKKEIDSFYNRLQKKCNDVYSRLYEYYKTKFSSSSIVATSDPSIRIPKCIIVAKLNVADIYSLSLDNDVELIDYSNYSPEFNEQVELITLEPNPMIDIDKITINLQNQISRNVVPENLVCVKVSFNVTEDIEQLNLKVNNYLKSSSRTESEYNELLTAMKVAYQELIDSIINDYSIENGLVISRANEDSLFFRLNYFITYCTNNQIFDLSNDDRVLKLDYWNPELYTEAFPD